MTTSKWIGTRFTWTQHGTMAAFQRAARRTRYYHGISVDSMRRWFTATERLVNTGAFTASPFNYNPDYGHHVGVEVKRFEW